MQRARRQRFVRALHASWVVLGVAVACTVADKGDYRFDDTPGSAGEMDGGSGGTSGSGKGGKGGTSGTSGSAGKGGTSGRGGTSGSTNGGSGGEGGEVAPPSGAGGEAGQPGVCGDDNVDPGEACDDGNLVTENCPYGAMTCAGCSDHCQDIRPRKCGDGDRNGGNATSFFIEYLATDCNGINTYVPLYLNGVLIPGLQWGTVCSCQPGMRSATVTDPAVLAAVRQEGNVLTLLSNYFDEFVAWAVITVVFNTGERIQKVAYDFAAPGDAEARNAGPAGCPYPPNYFFGYGVSDGAPFGGFPVEHCDGDANCYGCSRPQCITLSSTNSLAIPDAVGTYPGLVTDSVLVPQLGTIRDVNVTVNIQHPFVGDLAMEVVSPNTSALLVNRRGSSGQNFVDTVLDSMCTQPISYGLAPFTGCFAPEESLDSFNGFTSSIGYWYFNVGDFAASDAGVLAGWSLEVCGVP